MNQLARREVAIVSPHAGTTRDIIEVQLDLDGYPVTLIDTAGVRETDDPVEQEACAAPGRVPRKPTWCCGWSMHSTKKIGRKAGCRCGRCATRSISNGPDRQARELVPRTPGRRATSCGGLAHRRCQNSASRGDGIQQLFAALIAFAQDYFGSGEGGLISGKRQRKLLQQTAVSLERSIDAIEDGEELAAENLRIAAHSLGRLLGRVDVEDILD